MKMKTYLATLSFFLLLAGAHLEARIPRRGDGAREFPGKRMIEALDLTPQQVDTLRTIDADFLRQRETVRKESADRASVRKTVRKLREKRDAAVRDVLTPAQREKWETLRKERADQARKKRHAQSADRQ